MSAIHKHLILISVALAHFVDLFYFGVVLPIQKSVLYQFSPSSNNSSNIVKGASYSQATFSSYWQLIIFTSYALGYLVSTPFYGLISDHPKCQCLGAYHRKIPYIFSSIMLVISLILALIGRGGVTILIISRITQGISAAGTSVIGLALLSDSYDQERLGWSVSITMVFHAIGFSLGPLVGGLFGQMRGYRLPFFICLIPAILDLIFRVMIKKRKENSSSIEGMEEEGEAKFMQEMQKEQIKSHEKSIMKSPSLLVVSSLNNISFRRILRESEVWVIVGATLIGASTFGIIEGLLADYLMTNFNITNLQASLGLTFFILPSSMVGLVIGYVARSQDRYWIISIGLVIHGLVLCWPFISEKLWIFLPSAIIYGATHAMITQPPISELSGVIDRLSSNGRLIIDDSDVKEEAKGQEVYRMDQEDQKEVKENVEGSRVITITPNTTTDIIVLRENVDDGQLKQKREKCQSYARIYSIMNIVESLGMIVGPIFVELTKEKGRYVFAMIILANISFFYGLFYMGISRFKLKKGM